MIAFLIFLTVLNTALHNVWATYKYKFYHIGSKIDQSVNQKSQE